MRREDQSQTLRVSEAQSVAEARFPPTHSLGKTPFATARLFELAWPAGAALTTGSGSAGAGIFKRAFYLPPLFHVLRHAYQSPDPLGTVGAKFSVGCGFLLAQIARHI